MDVAIVGIGIHPFGRTAERSGMQQGAFAARAAMQDAGVDFKDMEFAYGGSHSAGSADALVRELGLTGLPFTNVANGSMKTCSSSAAPAARARSPATPGWPTAMFTVPRASVPSPCCNASGRHA